MLKNIEIAQPLEPTKLKKISKNIYRQDFA